MEKLNIAEILKDYPTGMELDCTMFDNVTFIGVNSSRKQFPIEIAISGQRSKYLTKEGCFHDNTLCPEAKCVIFPKGKTTWEGFQRPFKDGDVLYIDCNDGEDTYEQHQYIFILKQISEGKIDSYCYVNGTNESKFEICWLATMDDIKHGPRLATEEEKQKLFDAIKENGYKWDDKTKTLEKLIEPKFKVGDRVLWNYGTEIPRTISKVQFASKRGYVYWINCEGCSSGWWDETELTPIPNKFDITTLNPFDKVLVRDNDKKCWSADIYSHYLGEDKIYQFQCVGITAKQCIPYKNNEHLLGTTNDCDDYYKTWQ